MMATNNPFATQLTEFVVGYQGLQTSIHSSDIYTEDEWQKAELPANYEWEHVMVPSPENMQAWIAAKNRWLEAAWTPNQSPEDRAENARVMKEAETEMRWLRLFKVGAPIVDFRKK